MRSKPPSPPSVKLTNWQATLRQYWAEHPARHYQRAWLHADISAGLVLTAMLIPVGMSYAEASGLPAIYGLYATIVPLLIYAVMGPSRILVLGPDSALSGLIAITILPLAAGSISHAVALASMLALMTGGLCIVAGLARLGFVTDLLSQPIRYGYLNGIALTVLISQLPKLCGFEAEGATLQAELQHLITSLINGVAHLPTTALGLLALVIIGLCQHYRPQWPAMLLAMVIPTLLVAVFQLHDHHAVAVVGALPQGLPHWDWPQITWAELQQLAPSALAIALVAFADMSVLSRTYAQRLNMPAHPNRELVALGCANLGAGLFQGFPISSSASRTPVAESAGAKTQLTNVIGALCIVLMISFAPSLLHDVPRTALAAIIISACLALTEIKAVVRLYHQRQSEFWLSIGCFVGVALFGVVQGIFWSIGLGLAAFVWRAWRPYDAVLGRVRGVSGYHDIVRHPDAEQIDGLLLFRWDAPLFFANQESFRQHILHATRHANPPIHWVVIAAEPITDIDITAGQMLEQLEQHLSAQHIHLVFAELKGPAKDRLKDYGLYTNWGAAQFYPTIDMAVAQYLKQPSLAQTTP